MGLSKKEWVIVILLMILFLLYVFIKVSDASAEKPSNSKGNTLLVLYTDNPPTYQLGIQYFFRVSLSKDKRVEAEEYFQNIPGVISVRVEEYSILIDRGELFLLSEIERAVSDYLRTCSGVSGIEFSHDVGCDKVIGVNTTTCQKKRREMLSTLIQQFPYAGRCE